jgi:hypothetical protein
MSCCTLVPGFSVIAFNALYGPAGLPTQVLNKLAVDVRAVVGSREFAERTRNLGIDARSNTPEELDAWGVPRSSVGRRLHGLRTSSRTEPVDGIIGARAAATAGRNALYPGSGPVATGRDGSTLHADHDPT